MAIGQLVVKIIGDSAGLTSELTNAARSTDSFSTKARQSLDVFAKAAGTAMAAAGAAIVATTVATTKQIVELKNLADVANTSVGEFQAWAYASRTVGIENDKLADILKDVNDRVGDFLTTGGGPMADFFEKIAPRVGVTAEQFRNLSGPDALQLYVDSLQKANLSQAEMTFYMEAMASDSTRLIPLLKDGGEGLRGMAEEADQLGILLSEIDVAKVESASVSMSRLTQAGGGFAQALTVELAPIMSGIADEIINWTTEMGGFDNVARDTVDVLVTGAGYVADAWYGWELIIAGLKVAVLELSAAAANAVSDLAESVGKTATESASFFDSIFDGYTELGEKIQRGVFGKTLNEVTDDVSASAGTMSEVLRDMADTAATELAAIIAEGKPSDALQQWVEQTRVAAEQAAATVVETREKMAAEQTGPMGISDTGTEDFASSTYGDIDELRSRLAERTDTLAEWRELELENIQLQTEYEMELIQERYDLGLLAEQDYLSLKEQLAQDSARRMKDISDQETSVRLGAAKRMFSGLASLMNTESRKLFEIGKAAAIANSIVSGIEAAVDSFKFGAKIGGPYVGAAFAAVSAAATLAQIQQIRSTSFGGGGSGGGATAAAATPAAVNTGGGGAGTSGGEGQRNISISLTGSSFGAGGVRDLIAQINEAVGDGVTLRTTNGG